MRKHEFSRCGSCRVRQGSSQACISTTIVIHALLLAPLHSPGSIYGGLSLSAPSYLQLGPDRYVPQAPFSGEVEFKERHFFAFVHSFLSFPSFLDLAYFCSL